jgi:multidrug efflux system outer membrane protein
MQAAVPTAWWSTFHDPLLESLMARAVVANLDLRIAAARVREARALRGVSAAGQRPAVEGSSTYTHSRQSAHSPASGLPQHERHNDLFQIGFDARWEVDFFGGIRRAVEAADADVEVAIAERHAMVVTLLGEMARNYIDLRGAQSQLAITRDNLAAQQDTAHLTRVRFQAGLSSALNAAQAEAQVATTLSQLPVQERAIRQSIHRLSVLLGEPPATLEATLLPPTALPVATLELAVGLPAHLLQRRPDIRQAERTLAAATARVGVATAELYPRLSLSGVFGRQSVHLSDLLSSNSQFWSLGPTLRWPVFDAGRIRANIQVHDARQEQAMLHYEQAILMALEEVENALVAYSQEHTRRQALQAAVEANARALALANEWYTRGLGDFLNVLEAQRSLLNSQSQLVQSTTALASHVVTLYKALGGGWDGAE